MPNQAKRARETLGARLRDIRESAELTGRALADAAGWHFTKVSKLEHGVTLPSNEDIRTWCRLCHAEDRIIDLIAAARNVESAYREWRREMRAGLKRLQIAQVPLHERTTLFRIYETYAVCGLFHTPDYAKAIFSFWKRFMDIPDDVDAAVQARMERQEAALRSDKRIAVIHEEQALKTRIGTTETMTGQLERLLAEMTRPNVSAGIIPATGERRIIAQGAFWMYDDRLVTSEGISAGAEITEPSEIATYARAFALLQDSAVFGNPARALVHRALAELLRESAP